MLKDTYEIQAEAAREFYNVEVYEAFQANVDAAIADILAVTAETAKMKSSQYGKIVAATDALLERCQIRRETLDVLRTGFVAEMMESGYPPELVNHAIDAIMTSYFSAYGRIDGLVQFIVQGGGAPNEV